MVHFNSDGEMVGLSGYVSAEITAICVLGNSVCKATFLSQSREEILGLSLKVLENMTHG